MEDERKSQQNLTNVPRRITVTNWYLTYTHICLYQHITHVDKNTQCDIHLMEWLHSKIYGMIQVLICPCRCYSSYGSKYGNSWHNTQKIFYLTEYKTHFPIQLKNRGSSLYARLSYIQVNMYLSLSSINTLSYVKKYYCKTLSPVQNG